MKATDVIKRDHEAIKELFATYKATADEETKSDLENELFDALAAHEKMEDEHFYPVLNEVMSNSAVLDELEGEQKKLEMEVLAIRAITAVTGNREKRLTAAMEEVLKHAQKEEREIFPKAEALIDDERLEELGELMEPESAVAQSTMM